MALTRYVHMCVFVNPALVMLCKKKGRCLANGFPYLCRHCMFEERNGATDASTRGWMYF